MSRRRPTIPGRWASSLVAACVVAGLAVAPAAAQDAIRSVDFRNFTYEDTCDGEVRVTDGDATIDVDGIRGSLHVNEVVYGDLTGDGEEEAVVLTLCNGGGSMILSEGSIYTLRDGKPEVLARIVGGDRAEGGIARVRIADGFLVVTRYGTDDGLCCPTFTVTTTYRLDGGRLVVIGTPVRKPTDQ